MSIDYLHPSVSSKITDNSEVFQTSQGTTALFVASTFERGPDNVIREITSPDEYLFYYGKPNVSKYGQATLNTERWLKAGGKAFVLRVLPATALYSNLFLTAKTGSEAKTITITATNEKAGTASKAAIETLLTSEKANEIKLGAVIPKGRGKAYDGMGIRLSLRSDLDNTFESRTYNLSITVKDETGADVVVDGPYIVSFDPEARNLSRESIYWKEVVNKYSKYAEVLDNRSAFDKLAAYVLADKTEEDGEPVDPSHVDIIFGVERSLFGKTETIHDGVKWTQSVDPEGENYDEDAADLNNIVRLAAGSNGDFKGGDTEESLLVKAYSGVTVDSIRYPDQYEIDVILDGNYPAPVKNAIAELCEAREDCISILDCSFQGDAEKTIAYRKDSISMSNYRAAIFGQHMEVFDAHSGETVKVTSPYLLAERIPTIDNSMGIQNTFVGPRRGVVSGFSNINFYPNEQWKSNLYGAQVNYIERDPRKTNFATQLTSQVRNSALSQINNVRVALRIQRDVRKMMADYRMEFNDELTYDSMNYNLNNYLQKWTANRACTIASGEVYASAYDKQQNIVRVRIEVAFTGIIERVAIDINVVRRS
ncbi:hypothetical protein [Proteus mirabilis]|uniref:hypothetical protein n=1 Tax=Proteus mirabilis TaxID=584 RepID=UPI0034D3B4FF